MAMSEKKVKELKENIDAIFEKSESEADATSAMFRMVFPDFDDIEKIGGFVHTGKALGEYLWKKILTKTEGGFPGVWFNYGFGTDETLGPWEISTKDCPVTDKKNVQLKLAVGF